MTLVDRRTPTDIYATDVTLLDLADRLLEKGVCILRRPRDLHSGCRSGLSESPHADRLGRHGDGPASAGGALPMIMLYGAVDDAVKAARTFHESERDQVVILEAGEVSCVGRRMTKDPVGSLEDALRDQDTVVQRMMAACTVVPFRFRTVVAGVEDFHRELDGRATELARLLLWLRDRVELAIRARCREAVRAASARSGKEYLLSRRPHMPPPLVELHHLLLSRSVAATGQADGPCGMKGAYLVERGKVDEFIDHASDMASKQPGVTGLSVTGPWAPYSFVSPAWNWQDTHG